MGINAGDLIAEATLAIEMGCDAEDIALTIHPHPTLSETIAQSAEAFEGSITDLYMPKRKSAEKSTKVAKQVKRKSEANPAEMDKKAAEGSDD